MSLASTAPVVRFPTDRQQRRKHAFSCVRDKDGILRPDLDHTARSVYQVVAYGHHGHNWWYKQINQALDGRPAHIPIQAIGDSCRAPIFYSCRRVRIVPARLFAMLRYWPG